MSKNKGFARSTKMELEKLCLGLHQSMHYKGKFYLFFLPRFLMLLLFTASTTLAFGQKLSKRSSTASTLDSTMVYIDSALVLSSRSPLKAIEIINKAIELSIRYSESFNEAKAYWVLGSLQQQLSQHELALNQFRKSELALDRNKSKKDSYAEYKKSDESSSYQKQELRFKINLNTAQSHIALRNTSKALEAIKKCTSSEFTSISPLLLREAKRLEAQLLSQKGQNPQAIKQLNTLLDAERLEKNTVGEIETLLLLGSIYKQMGNNSLSKEQFLQAKKVAEQARLSNYVQKANAQLAFVFQREGRLDEEIVVRNQNLDLNSKAANSNSVQRDKFYNQPIEIVDKSTDKSKEKNSTVGNANPIKDIELNVTESSIAPVVNAKQDEVILQENASNFKRLAEVYTQKNDVNKAIDYYKQYAKLQDSIIAAKTNELAEIIELSTNIGKNQQRIEMMEQERRLSDKSIEILQQDRDLKQSQLKNRNTIIITLSLAFVALLAGGWMVLRNLKARRKADKLLTLQSLGGQMNPHFIFNALNSVNEYIATNDERAANRYLTDFSRLMRKVLDDSRHAFIPLSEELKMLKLYLQLEHARFKDKFEYELNIDSGLDESELLIPPMLLQPYIENAVWHGLRYLDSTGKLKIDVVPFNSNGLKITIEDNGIGIEKSKELKTKNQKKQESLGMKNIDTRVQLLNELYPISISVDVSPANEKAENAGTKVILTMFHTH